MKGKKHREEGGRNLAEEDLKDKPMRYTADSNVSGEAEERKKGGRAKRMRGGHVHHEKMEKLAHAKHHAGRKPRKDGGRTGADAHPFSSARKGENPPGRKEMDID